MASVRLIVKIKDLLNPRLRKGRKECCEKMDKWIFEAIERKVKIAK